MQLGNLISSLADFITPENISAFFTTAIAILFIITTHEFAHAIVAYYNGDDTAKLHGRLTLNPLKHIDIAGLIFFIIFKFGWAKPVPINLKKFKNERIGMFTTSIAGIVVNLLTSFFAMLLVHILYYSSAPDFIIELLYKLIIYGISFAIFNFLPIPPLDGSNIIYSVMPVSIQNKWGVFSNLSYVFYAIVIFTDIVTDMIFPIVDYIFELFSNIAYYLVG